MAGGDPHRAPRTLKHIVAVIVLHDLVRPDNVVMLQQLTQLPGGVYLVVARHHNVSAMELLDLHQTHLGEAFQRLHTYNIVERIHDKERHAEAAGDDHNVAQTKRVNKSVTAR